MASEQQTGTLSVYGSQTGDIKDTHQVIVNFLCNDVVAAGEWVALDVGQATALLAYNTVTLAGLTPLVTGDPLAVGVAMAPGVVGGQIPVLIEGYYPAAVTDDATVNAVGLALDCGKVTSGVAYAYEHTDAGGGVGVDLAPVLAISLAASSSGVAPVWVIRRY